MSAQYGSIVTTWTPLRTGLSRSRVYDGRGGLVPGVDPKSNRSLNDLADDA
jgi:hypothetical protein